jgi:hypothetical protein
MTPKLKTSLLALTTAMALSTAHAQIVQQWLFNDGTNLTTTSNSIVGGKSWASNPVGYSVSGGLLSITSNTLASAGAESFTATPALGYTSSIYQIDTRLSWNIVTNADDQLFHIGFMNNNTTETTTDISVEYRTATGLVNVYSRAFPTSATVVHTQMYSGYELSESGIDLRLIVNFDTNTREILRHDGSGYVSIGSAAISSARDGNYMRIRAAGVWNGTGEFMRVDNITVTAIPEPGTLALVGLSGVAILMGLRRRRG